MFVSKMSQMCVCLRCVCVGMCLCVGCVRCLKCVCVCVRDVCDVSDVFVSEMC